MRLEAIQIFGFKSFADKATLEFPHNRIAIVGPNGCGKSNIVDAVKWVLGDQSAKSVRAQKMSELIFNGTSKRAPLQLADVSIHFDNREKTLPVEGQSVTIRRTLHRDGNTEYRINNKLVRLRDIRSMFLDSGIGLFEYAILEQGKIDQLLSLRPEQRLQYFDEAAGIANLRNRGREIEQNIKRARENKEVLALRIGELQELQTTRAIQAEELERFQRLEKELKRLEAVLQHRNVNDSKQDHEKLSEKATRLQAKNTALRSLMQTNKAEIGHKHHAMRKLEQSHTDTEKLLLHEQMKRESEKNEALRLRQELQRSETLREQRTKSFKQLSDLYTRQRAQEEADKKQLDVLQEQIKLLLEQLESTKKLRTESERREADIRKKVEEGNQKLYTIQEQQSEWGDQRVQAFDHLMQIVSDSDVQSFGEKNRILQQVKDDLDAYKYILEKNDTSIRHYELLHRIYNAMQGLFDETSSVLHSLFEYIQKATALDTSIEQAKKEATAIKDLISSLQSELQVWNKKRADSTKACTSEANQVQQKQYRADLLQDQVANREDILKNIRQQQSDVDHECQELHNQIQDLREAIHAIEPSTAQEQTIQRSLGAIKTKIAHLKKELKDIETANESTKLEITEIEQNLQKNEIARVRLTERIASLQDRSLEAVNDQDPLLQEETKTLMDRQQLVKREIHAVGKLNFLAMDEKSAYGEKLQELTEQETDVQKSLQDLEEVYALLQDRVRKQLHKSIQKLDGEFNAVFKTLFQGGEARVLLSDEENIEKGIRIIAKPPGKKPNDIMQLSGGERTLAATALLFASYLVQPSPFCILDEVDAMLDERNIGRFLQMLYSYTDRTQFIIVTHNVQTMAAMDALIGVTMEEQGVSKLVSVRIDEEMYASP